MKAEELRINNYIIANGLYEGKIMQVEQIGSKGTLTEDKRVILFKDHGVGEYIKDIEPIPITEEWVSKFGFTKFRKLQFRKRITLACDLEIAFLDSKIVIAVVKHEQRRNQVFKLRYINHVHELQNIFYWISAGQELTLKE